MVDTMDNIEDELEGIALTLLADDWETFKAGGKSSFAGVWEKLNDGKPSDMSLGELRDVVKEKLSTLSESDLEKLRNQAKERIAALDGEMDV